MRRREFPSDVQIELIVWGIQQQLSLSKKKAIQFFEKVVEKAPQLAPSIYNKVSWDGLTENERKKLLDLILGEGELS